jgi:hypothetical protein
MTFSTWRVNKPIPVFIICHHNDFRSKSSWARALCQQYLQYAQRMPADAFESSLKVNLFLGDEFAKQVNPKTKAFDYMISAIFSEVTTRSPEDNVGGIYYPSVRTDGMVYNVAITPEHVDSSLQLIAAGECVLYKRGQNCILDLETATEIVNDRQPFTLASVEAQYHFRKENSLAKLQHL